MELVVEDVFLVESPREDGCDFCDEVTLFSGEGEGDAEAFGLHSSTL
ncbi:MAG: hypothetical protein ACJ74Q_08750 [Pyrinomonadaceae bacterium]